MTVIDAEAQMSKTWQQKFESAKPPHVVTLRRPFAGLETGARMFIASPTLIARYINEIPHGETRSLAEMRRELATSAGADTACPTSTSIFVQIVAETALEALAPCAPIARMTPFWRLVDERSPLACRLSCGPQFVRLMRDQETRSAPDPARS